jgi:Fe-S cluster biogenesis protein NfuA
MTMLDQYKDQIEKALDTIRPYLEADGGNVKIVDLSEDMVLQLELTGACSSCPMSTMTLKAGVEEAIKKAIPEIIRVEAVNIEVA